MSLKNDIFNYLKYTLFVVVFMSMSIQNSITTIYLFTDIDPEIVEVDWEEETDDEDNKEEESDNEKTELEFRIYNTVFYTFNNVENIFIQAPFWEFNFDIQTPPPDSIA